MAARAPRPSALIDTSVFIALEAGRTLGSVPTASTGAVSVVTLAELQLGVLMARDSASRASRLQTLSTVQTNFQPLDIDSDVARAFAQLSADARRTGRRPGVMDMWIAASALAYGLVLYTQDAGFLQF